MAEIAVNKIRKKDQQIIPEPVFNETLQRQKVKEYFDLNNNWKGEIYSTSSDRHALGVRRRVKYIFEILDNLNCFTRTKAIDIGCGPGMYLDELLKRGCDTVGIELSGEMLKVCKKKFESEKKRPGFSTGDILSLPFRDESFEIALCIGVLQYVVSAQQAIKELYRITAKDGVIVICVENLASPGNFGFYLKQKIKSLWKISLVSTDTEYSGLSNISRWFLSRVNIPHLYKLYNPRVLESILKQFGFNKINSMSYGFTFKFLRRMKILQEASITRMEIKIENFLRKYRIPYISGLGEFYIGVFIKDKGGF